MTDKNGVELKTGQVVEITGAFFKNDNGLWLITNTPGDVNWLGSECALVKVSGSGKISTAKYRHGFWPVSVCLSNPAKRHEANAWNAEHAEVEVVTIPNMDGIIAYFQDIHDANARIVQREVWDFGEEAEVVRKDKAILEHYRKVIDSLKGGAA